MAETMTKRPRRLARHGAARMLALLVCAMGAAANAAVAQDGTQAGDIVIGIDLGWAGFRSAGFRPDGTRLSLHARVHLSPRLAVAGDITCLGGTEAAPADAGFTLCTGSLSGIVQVRMTPALTSHVRLGVGQAQLDRGAAAGVYDIDARAWALVAGAGSRLALGHRRRVALRLDASWLRTDALGSRATHVSIAGGIEYGFGRTRRAD